MTDIISKKTRLEFREYFVTTTLRHVSREFDAADVACDANYNSSEAGARRSLVEQYYHSVDFSSWRDVRKVLRVYENVMLSLEDRIKSPLSGNEDKYAERTFTILTRCLERDRLLYSDEKIRPATGAPAVEELAHTAHALDAQVLQQQIERMRNAVDGDPDLAIGTAKELLETTCKTILADYAVQADPSWDMTRLVKEARAVLRLVPQDVPDIAKGADIVKRLLSNLGQVSQGLAELRNLYGTGHGKDGRAKGLSSRHARLAVACASGLATFLFETHQAGQEKNT